MPSSLNVNFGYINEVHLLGHVVGNEGIKVDPTKIASCTRLGEI